MMGFIKINKLINISKQDHCHHDYRAQDGFQCSTLFLQAQTSEQKALDEGVGVGWGCKQHADRYTLVCMLWKDGGMHTEMTNRTEFTHDLKSVKT